MDHRRRTPSISHSLAQDPMISQSLAQDTAFSSGLGPQFSTSNAYTDGAGWGGVESIGHTTLPVKRRGGGMSQRREGARETKVEVMCCWVEAREDDFSRFFSLLRSFLCSCSRSLRSPRCSRHSLHSRSFLPFSLSLHLNPRPRPPPQIRQSRRAKG